MVYRFTIFIRIEYSVVKLYISQAIIKKCQGFSIASNFVTVINIIVTNYFWMKNSMDEKKSSFTRIKSMICTLKNWDNLEILEQRKVYFYRSNVYIEKYNKYKFIFRKLSMFMVNISINLYRMIMYFVLNMLYKEKFIL